MSITKIFKIFIMLIIISCGTVHAEIKTYEGVGEYLMSDFETIEVAKQRAKAYAERNAKEKAGVYVSSYSKSENLQIAADEIETMTATILKVTDVKYETVSTGEGVMYRATVKVNIDSEEIPNWLKRDAKERAELVKQNKELKNSFYSQEKNIKNLKGQLFGTNNPNDKERIKREIEKSDKEFLSNQKLVEGNQLFDKKDFSGALKSFNEAIELNPDNIFAYFQRGRTATLTNNFSMAISDMTKYLSYYPKDAFAYFTRAGAYLISGNIAEGMTDLNKAIEVNPNYTEAYKIRGEIYEAIGETALAEADYRKAGIRKMKKIALE